MSHMRSELTTEQSQNTCAAIQKRFANVFLRNSISVIVTREFWLTELPKRSIPGATNISFRSKIVTRHVPFAVPFIPDFSKMRN